MVFKKSVTYLVTQSLTYLPMYKQIHRGAPLLKNIIAKSRYQHYGGRARIICWLLQQTIYRTVSPLFIIVFVKYSSFLKTMQNFYFLIIRDRTFKLKFRYFHFNLRNSKMFFLPGVSKGGKNSKQFVSLLLFQCSNCDFIFLQHACSSYKFCVNCV